MESLSMPNKNDSGRHFEFGLCVCKKIEVDNERESKARYAITEACGQAPCRDLPHIYPPPPDPGYSSGGSNKSVGSRQSKTISLNPITA
jgi:hypothetical protein